MSIQEAETQQDTSSVAYPMGLSLTNLLNVNGGGRQHDATFTITYSGYGGAKTIVEHLGAGHTYDVGTLFLDTNDGFVTVSVHANNTNGGARSVHLVRPDKNVNWSVQLKMGEDNYLEVFAIVVR